MKGTTEHTEYTESRSAKEPSVCSVYSVVGEGTTEHTEYTGSRSAKEPSVCPVYSVVGERNHRTHGIHGKPVRKGAFSVFSG